MTVIRCHARDMRHAQTFVERRLWSWLRDRRCLGYKFKRQVPIGRYIVDFYCAELDLVIEVDGRHHETSWMSGYDGRRTLELERRGIRVLRIPNEVIVRDSLLAGEMVRAAIRERPPHPPSAPSPPHGGGEGER